jgi:hypothetical protein
MFSRSRWRPFATVDDIGRSDGFSLKALVVAVLVGGVALVFWQQLVGDAVLIGESDRLNSYLNMRLAEYDALRTYARVTAWNPTMFAGFSVTALHWMNPGTDPISYFLQLFPRDRVYQALGYVSIALVLAACTTAYFYIRDLTGARIAAAVGGLCYGLSVFGLHRIAQVDNAYLTLILLPAAMLAIRRVGEGNLIRPLVGLTLSMSALAFWGFLQEVAYAFCFLAAYAWYRAAVSSKHGPKAALAVLIVFGAGSLVALLFAAPRLITLGLEFVQLARTSAYHLWGYQEFLRFFHEGIYGRYYAESSQIGNFLNLHEGLQLISSTTVALFVCFGALRPSNRSEAVAGLLLFAMILALKPIYRIPASAPWPSQELVNIGLYFCILSAIVPLLRQSGRYFRFETTWEKLIPPAPRPTDTVFHLFALALVLFLVLVPEGYYGVYLLFGSRDFTHARLSILGLLPLCSLFAVYLAELKRLPFGAAVAHGGSLRTPATALGIFLGAAFLSWLIHGPAIDQLVPKTAFEFRPYQPYVIVMPPVAVKVVLTAIVLAAGLAGLLWTSRRRFDGGIAAAIVVATFAFVETVTYAHFKVDGPHTWTYPIPFGTSNYMNVPPAVMRPPGEERLKAFAEKLEVGDFRSALLSERSFYPDGALTSHISQFWRARMIGGYGTGVPKRLADLPWPEGVRSLRTIELRSMSDVDPALLSLLNVKYLLILSPDLYFDIASERPDTSRSALTLGSTAYPGEIVNIEGISFGVIKNPLAPLARHFLVEKVTGVRETPTVQGTALQVRAHPANESHDGAGTPALIGERIDQLTSHSLAEDFGGAEVFDASGPLDVAYKDDVIDVSVIPSNRDRFLVINERYHPDWRARAATEDIPIFPTNAVMMGIRIPATLDRIQLRFEPFSSSRAAHMLTLLALVTFLAAIGAFWFWSRRMRPRNP